MFYEIDNWAHWRDVCRELVHQRVAPTEVQLVPRGTQSTLFAEESPQLSRSAAAFKVPKEFVELSEAIACHRAEDRWQLLYRTLWRLTQGQPHLLQITTDDDVLRLHRMEKEIRRDCHKMKAFVRFRRVIEDDDEHYIAWHRPDHYIVERTAPFFMRRFQGMRWTILTPERSASWDGQALEYGPGVPRSEAPAGDELESLWKTYYGSTFNPARIKLKMMRKEMPVRHWATLPETEIIDQLLDDAPSRVDRMVAHAEGLATSARDFLPSSNDNAIANAMPVWTYAELHQAAKNCRGCELCGPATQTVFGEGPVDARIVLIGEQPGDVEDEVGRPFVGPAGQLLDEILREAGIERDSVYLTNSVKHFHFEPRGKQRLHKKPNARHMSACRPWLEAEMNLVQPQVLVCLGATALQSVVGRHVRLGDVRGQFIVTPLCAHTTATWHPAAILRSLPEQQAQRKREMIEDLRMVLMLRLAPQNS